MVGAHAFTNCTVDLFIRFERNSGYRSLLFLDSQLFRFVIEECFYHCIERTLLTNVSRLLDPTDLLFGLCIRTLLFLRSNVEGDLPWGFLSRWIFSLLKMKHSLIKDFLLCLSHLISLTRLWKRRFRRNQIATNTFVSFLNDEQWNL